nr:MAG TPA: hypothetical protein [Caudoviricetes sp.]
MGSASISSKVLISSAIFLFSFIPQRHSPLRITTKEPTTEKTSVAGSYCPFPRPITQELNI